MEDILAERLVCLNEALVEADTEATALILLIEQQTPQQITLKTDLMNSLRAIRKKITKIVTRDLIYIRDGLEDTK